MLEKTSIGDTGGAPPDELATAIVAIPAGARQRKLAFRVFIVFIVIAVANAPLSIIQLGPAHSFLPVIQSLICAASLLTATFLFVQFSLYPQRALLALAGGFMFCGLFALLHTFAFPAGHSSAVLIGDTINSPSWLFAFWQATFALSITAYALWKRPAEPIKRSVRSIWVELGVTIACVLTVTAALAWLATTGTDYLPAAHQGLVHRTSFIRGVTVVVALLNAVAFAILLLRKYTLLDQWLMVTLAAWWPTTIQALFTDLRFSEGWYLGRIYALFAGSSLLVVLLTETLLLHRRYEHHQRQLIRELDHRVKNVLAQVGAVVSATRQSSHSILEFSGSVDGRIQAMAVAHTLLSRSGWHSVSLDTLARNQLAPYITAANVMISGPHIMLAPAEIQAMSQVLHELATNAAKYGALSIPSGQVSLNWGLKLNGVSLLWREFGGPLVKANVKSSYGSDLICELIPHELGGTVDLVFAKEGVTCKIWIPLQHRETI